jgi:hypothetical protein
VPDPRLAPSTTLHPHAHCASIFEVCHAHKLDADGSSRELCKCSTLTVHVRVTTHRTLLLRPRTHRSTSGQYRIGRNRILTNCITTPPRDRSRRARGPRNAWHLAAPPWTALGPVNTSLNTSPGLARTEAGNDDAGATDTLF